MGIENPYVFILILFPGVTEALQMKHTTILDTLI